MKGASKRAGLTLEHLIRDVEGMLKRTPSSIALRNHKRAGSLSPLSLLARSLAPSLLRSFSGPLALMRVPFETSNAVREAGQEQGMEGTLDTEMHIIMQRVTASPDGFV